ncbi:MAG: DUF2628 domain-containing protein [Pseudomonadota bacterium]
MATYAVYLPPKASNIPSLEGFTLLPDARTPWALIAPPIWLIWHRLWLPLLVYVLVVWAVLLLAYWQPGTAVLYLSAIPGLYLLLEGSELIRAKFERKGWRYWGIVTGDNREEAEIRFVSTFEETETQIRTAEPATHRPVFHKPATATGLFPE